MPDTTVMRSSQVGDKWIEDVCKANPVQRVYDATGADTGVILTGPVRLSWCDSLFTAKKQMQSDPNSKLKHSTAILFTPFTDLSIFYDEYYRIAGVDFAEFWNPDMNAGAGDYVGLDNPLWDQALKSHKYEGYTPGLMTMNVSSDFKPPITDARGNPIVDEKKVYPGVWAIVAVSGYASGKNFPRKGPRFGLQGVVIIGDDKSLGGGAMDMKNVMGAVKVQAPTAVSTAAFGQRPGAAPPNRPGASTAAYTPAAGIPAARHLPRPPAPPAAGAGEDDYSQFG